MNKVDYSPYLKSDETLNPDDVKDGMILVKLSTVRKRKHDQEHRLTTEQQEALAIERAEAAEEHRIMKDLDLRFFGDSAFDHPAGWMDQEVHIHRQFLRALDQPDVQPGETLKMLAERVWNALFSRKPHLYIEKPDGSFYATGFEPKTQDWSFYGWRVKPVKPIKPGDASFASFAENWRPPRDCTGDEVIDLESLPALPPKEVAKKLKPEQDPPQPPQPRASTPAVVPYCRADDQTLDQRARDYLSGVK
jgi:hypothetical protein